MRTRFRNISTLAVMLAALPAWAQSSDGDVKKLAPVEAHLVVYGQHNAERDFQRAYGAEIWQTIQDEQICERVMGMITSNVPADDVAQAQAVFDELKAAVAPIELSALENCQGVLYAQVLEVPFNHHLLAFKLGEEHAANYMKGVRQLMELAAEKSQGEVKVAKSKVGDATIVELVLPFNDNMPGKPFEPAVAQLGDLFLFTSKVDLLRDAITRYQEGGESKFDDARLKAALADLPEAEDAVVFFDGEKLFEQLHGIEDFVEAASNGNEEAKRAMGIMNAVINECEIIDYAVTVEYTEGNQNRTATLGKLSDDAPDKLLYQAVSQGQPFESWQDWAPADADGYSLATGVNLHVLYEGIIEFVRREIPESHEPLDQWEQIQADIGVHLDRDILQSFSGETVSITLPGKARDGSDTQYSVTALKCSNSDKVRELLHRGFEGLNNIPAVKAQQLSLVPCDGLEGFDKLQAPTLAMFGVTPVVGFYDGWMMCASNQEAVERVIAVRKGEADSIAGAESLEQFNLDVDGTVYAVKYTDIAKSIHQVADAIEGVSAFLPMALGMAGANASPEEMKPIQEVVGLLPSIANVIRKFDFMEKSLMVTKEGPRPMTYVTDTSMIIRAPETK